jgi:hypothetical protein
MEVRWYLSNEDQELWEALNFDSKLIFEKKYSCHKYLYKKKVILPLRICFEMVKERRNFNAPSLKMILRG